MFADRSDGLSGAIFYNLFAGVFGGVEVKLRPWMGRPPRRPASRCSAAVALHGFALNLSGRPPGGDGLVGSPGGAPLAARQRDPYRQRAGKRPSFCGLAPQHAEIRASGRYLIYDLGSRRVGSTTIRSPPSTCSGRLSAATRQTEFTVHIQANHQAKETA